MIQPGTAVWFARHESRLAWRDWVAMMTAGKAARRRRVALGIAAFVIGMHAVAYFVVGGFATAVIDKHFLIGVSATVLLSWLLMVSQAMESITRAFYTRADLDLDSRFTGRRAAPVRGADRHRRARGRRDGVAARRSFHQHARLPRRLALAWRLRRDPGDGCGRHRRRGRAHRGAVSRHRAEAHAAHRAGARRHHRRRLRDRAAGRGHSLLRHLVARRRAAIANAGSARARSYQRALVAGARRARRHPGARRRAHRKRRSARRHDCAGRAALRRLCHRGVRRRRFTRRAPAPRNKLPRRLAARRASPQGMAPSPPRSLARFADPDADALSAPARDPSLAHVRSWRRRAQSAGAGAGHGGGPARRRPRLAHHLGRGRARSCCYRADPAALRAARQDRSRDRHHRRDLCAAGRGHRRRLALARRDHRRRHRHRGCVRHRDPALVPHPGEAQPIPPPPGLLARRHLRRGFFLHRLGRHRRRCRGQSAARRPARPDRARRRRRHAPAGAAAERN